MSQLSPLHAPHFAATATPEAISKRLHEDEALINARKPCSWVAYHLPEYETDRGFEIAACFTLSLDLGHEIKKLIYENCISRIRRYLEKDRASNTTPDGTIREMEIAQHALLPSELLTTLKVIAHLQENAIIQRDTAADTIMVWLEERIASGRPKASISPEEPAMPVPPPMPRKRLCYICRMAITAPYPTQPSMCIPCGSFNLSSSLLSTPSRLVLPQTFTALVTGARLNLGYHTALRLLRCGARVIATTRYPHDAISRYIKEHDSSVWRDRLRIIGADFRSAKDAHDLVHETKQCLKQWAHGEDAKLSALINNAAQTLTDSVKKEERAMKREDDLRKRIAHREFLIDGGYKARVRGRELPMRLESTTSISVPALEAPDGHIVTPESADTTDPSHETTAQLEPYTKSSWVQSIPEIPYEDVGSALSVNTFVPFILCRELLPLMGNTTTDRSNDTALSSKPQGYIINVSSREGVFETHTSSPAKRGKHVHTNMSKAALNMLTETEAETAWRGRRVAMNTVDPGYMSAAPEYEDAFESVRPIGWEDGAGRVLWPIAAAEIGKQVVWGRFLKHYGAVEGEASRG
jgi:NAD(P)-dependent dehydrogenase (short-subunit alcohol dehydrogenase family)